MEWMLMPYRRYADFSGRSRRKEYWMFALFMGLLGLATTIVETVTGMPKIILGLYGPLTALLFAGSIIPQLAVGVRRLHDIDRTGWWLAGVYAPYAVMIVGVVNQNAVLMGIAALVVVVMAITLLVFHVTVGTSGPNTYGPDPLDPNQTEVFS